MNHLWLLLFINDVTSSSQYMLLPISNYEDVDSQDKSSRPIRQAVKMWSGIEMFKWQWNSRRNLDDNSWRHRLLHPGHALSSTWHHNIIISPAHTHTLRWFIHIFKHTFLIYLTHIICIHDDFDFSFVLLLRCLTVSQLQATEQITW